MICTVHYELHRGLSGLSYAGHYVPWMAKAVLDHPTIPLSLRGVAVGDPLISHVHHAPAYLQPLTVQKHDPYRLNCSSIRQEYIIFMQHVRYAQAMTALGLVSQSEAAELTTIMNTSVRLWQQNQVIRCSSKHPAD